MDTGLNENKAEFGVLILAVSLKVLTDSNGLLDQHVEILWDFRSEAVRLEDSENLVSSNHLHLGDAVRISENNTNLRGSGTLLGELADLVDDLLGGCLEPGGRSTRVWESRGRYALSVGV